MITGKIDVAVMTRDMLEQLLPDCIPLVAGETQDEWRERIQMIANLIVENRFSQKYPLFGTTESPDSFQASQVE